MLRLARDERARSSATTYAAPVTRCMSASVALAAKVESIDTSITTLATATIAPVICTVRRPGRRTLFATSATTSPAAKVCSVKPTTCTKRMC